MERRRSFVDSVNTGSTLSQIKNNSTTSTLTRDAQKEKTRKQSPSLIPFPFVIDTYSPIQFNSIPLYLFFSLFNTFLLHNSQLSISISLTTTKQIINYNSAFCSRRHDSRGIESEVNSEWEDVFQWRSVDS